MAKVDSDFSFRVVQRFMVWSFAAFPRRFCRPDDGHPFFIVGGFLVVFAQCYINSRVVICLFAFMLNVFSYHFRTCVFDWRFPCYRQEKGGCLIVFLRGLLSLRYFSLSTYICLSGRLSDQIMSCKFPFYYLFLFFSFIYLALHVYFISPDYDRIGRLSVFSLLNSRIPNEAFYPA